MNILLIAIIVLVVAGHTATAFLDGALCRILAYLTIALHPFALIPMLLLSLPLEAVALFFLSSALYRTVISLAVGHIRKADSPTSSGGDEA